MCWVPFSLLLCDSQNRAAGVVCGFGDVIAQWFIEGKRISQHDVPRTLRMTAIGLFFTVSSMVAQKDKVSLVLHLGPSLEGLVSHAG